MRSSRQIREALADEWNRRAAQRSVRLDGDAIDGSSPPSVFVGSYGYPRVGAGPVLPPVHGDTSVLDAPERWAGSSLGEIVGYRLGLVRGVREARVDRPSGRYIESLQEIAMASRPADVSLSLEGRLSSPSSPRDDGAAFGPVARISEASFSAAPALRAAERAHADTDATATESVMSLYRAGVPVSQIQKCLSVGMLGRRRRLVPTRWSITAVDSAISRELVRRALDAPLIDGHRVFGYSALGNSYAVIIYPHAWRYEMVEAWHARDGSVGFGADSEGPAGMRGAPSIAGAYFAGRLAVAEYMERAGVQGGALVLREILPEYSVPVGVWQVREGARAAMRAPHHDAEGLAEAVAAASSRTSISASEWLAHASTPRALLQRTLDAF